jgi:hypothetical protein
MVAQLVTRVGLSWEDARNMTLPQHRLLMEDLAQANKG